ncbi:hypothetical protein [Rhodobacter sp. NSM]|uniref:hypothetical protein n=1 Tax=Rhodobacter sp. NSM TaxID=3457501 RepID=UPI003FD2658C
MPLLTAWRPRGDNLDGPVLTCQIPGPLAVMFMDPTLAYQVEGTDIEEAGLLDHDQLVRCALNWSYSGRCLM